MEWLALLSGLLMFFLTAAFLSPIGTRIDKQRQRLLQLQGTVAEEVDEEFQRPFAQRFLVPLLFSVLRVISKFFPKSRNGGTSKIEKDLKLAGIKLSAGEFLGVRLIIMFISLGLGFFPLLIETIPPMIKLMALIFGAVLAILIPRYYLQSKIKRRQNGIRLQMPDVLDLLSVSVESGLGFDAALIRVSEYSEGPLVDELITVHREMQMGRPRRDALKDLGERSNVTELQMFASAVIQADQLGISIKNVLKAQSQQLRLARKQRAEEKAMKAPVKMMIPLVIFIFPVVFIILLGPSAVEIMKTFGG